MSTKLTYYKSLNPDGSTPQGYGHYDTTNLDWQPAIEGKLAACQNGYHLLRLEDILNWECPELWLVEAKGRVVRDDNRVVARSFRFVRRLDTWNERTQRLLACDCAEHVLHLYEETYPGDNRVRRCIETARLYAEGKVTQEELRAARDAARDATRDAAGAAGDAIWAAAWTAARDAARAAGYADGDAAEAAAWAAAGVAERKWQIERMRMYLSGEVY